MGRSKQVNPMPRINSGEIMQTPSDTPEPTATYSRTNGHASPTHRKPSQANGAASKSPKATKHSGSTSKPANPQEQQAPSLITLVVCVSGIYASFLTWALLQERITTTPYLVGTSAQPETEYFRFPVVLNTIQSLLAFISGSLYLLSTRPRSGAATLSSVFLPSAAALPPLALVTLTSSLASPFGYASLAHVDYLTFVLAKSCKLLPVMFLHVTLFRKRYPLQKYLIVLLVTSGVAVFTLYHPPKPGKSTKGAGSTSLYGLSLLAVNLLFDGLTNTVQDHIFSSPARYGRLNGPQMMVSLNCLSTLLTSAYLLLTPLIPPTLLPPSIAVTDPELPAALAFFTRHPSVLRDILGFCLCGAVGQLFIYATLERFSSLLLVTVTVTRKMLTMLLSVLWFGKTLTMGQWGGVALVFGGIAGEAELSRREKLEKERRKAEALAKQKKGS